MRLFAVVLILCVAPYLVRAQEKSDSLKHVVKEDVIVISTRYPEEQLRVPLAVSSVPEYLFRDSRGYEMKDALWQVPGILAQPRSGHTDLRITVRGYGARGSGDRSNAGDTRSIRILIDGIPETEPDGRTSLDNIDLSAFSKVEVLRSNTSVLYGSSSGGVINLFLPNAFPGPFADFATTFGSYGYQKYSFSAGAADSTNHYFVDVSSTAYDGYRDHSNSSTGNGYFLADLYPEAATHVEISALASTNMFRFPGPLTFEQFESNPLMADSLYKARDDHRFNRQGRVGVTIDHAITDEHSVSGTVYLRPRILSRSERNTWREFNRYTIGSLGKYTWAKEIDEQTNNVFLLGFDQAYQDGTVQFFNLGPGASRGTMLKENHIEASSNVGLYAQEEFETGDLSLTIGGRYNFIRYKLTDLMTTNQPSHLDFSAFTPRLSLGYRLSNEMSVYGLYSEGLEVPANNEYDQPDSATLAEMGGAFDSTYGFNPLLVPSISQNIEAGWKGVIEHPFGANWITSLACDAALFYIYITNDIVPWNGGAFYFTAGKTRRYGGELSLTMHTRANITLQAAYTAMKATYLEYQNNFGHFNGNEMGGVPKNYGSVRLHYLSPLNIYIEGSTEFVSSYYADDRNDKKTDGSPDPTIQSLVPAYMIFNAGIGYEKKIAWGLAIRLFADGRNLGGKNYVSSVFVNGTNNRYFEPGMPRNVVIGAAMNYGF
jgi:iron complex outermembrane receptor protein